MEQVLHHATSKSLAHHVLSNRGDSINALRLRLNTVEDHGQVASTSQPHRFSHSEGCQTESFFAHHCMLNRKKERNKQKKHRLSRFSLSLKGFRGFGGAGMGHPSDKHCSDIKASGCAWRIRHEFGE